MIMQFLLEWGILGIIILIVIYATYVKYMFLHISNGFTKMSPSVLAASSTIFALGIHGLVDGTWYYPQPVFTQILCFAVVMGELKATTIRPCNS
jgi:hypothetical protein